jgi:Bacterial alpha-L-rhamnosidase 6 hairpin glycosidase domain
MLDDLAPDTRFADAWDAAWAVTEPGGLAVLARTRFPLPARPFVARAWFAAAGLWSWHPQGFLSAAPDPPHATVTVNGEIIDLPRHVLLRGQAVELDLASILLEATNEISIQAIYDEPPTVFGMIVPMRIAVFCQADLELADGSCLRLATGDRPSLSRLMPSRPPLPSSVWGILTRTGLGNAWEPTGGSFLHPLAASPLLRFPRRGSAIEAAIDATPPSYRHELHAPAPLRTLAPQETLVQDFGEELVGHLVVQAEAAAVLIVAPGESHGEATDLDERLENPVRKPRLAAAGTWRDPRRSALRYAMLRNDGPSPVVCRVGFDAQEADVVLGGEFASADPLLDRIYETGRRTILRCTHDWIEDGPKRDRLLWLGDLAAMVRAFASTIGDLRPVRRSLLLAAANQHRSGALAGVGPHPNTLVVADYIPQWIIALDEYLWHSGDLDTAALCWPTLQRALHFLVERIGPEGLVGPEEACDWWVFLDWEKREPFGCPVERRGSVTVLSMMTAAACDAAARVADGLGESRSADRWRQYGARLREQICERCWDGDQGGFVDWASASGRSRKRSRLTAAWAVLARVGSADQQRVVVDDLASPTGRLRHSTTGYGQYYNVEALFRGGRPQAALDLVRRYWGGMLGRGASTFWESFDPSEEPEQEFQMYGRRWGQSLCHGWSGAVVAALAGHVLGVRPGSAGSRSVTVQPAAVDVDWVRGVVCTAAGPVTVSRTGTTVDVMAPPEIDLLRA